MYDTLWHSHDFVGVAQAIILTIIFCKVNTITLLGEVPINISAHQYGLPETQLWLYNVFNLTSESFA